MRFGSADVCAERFLTHSRLKAPVALKGGKLPGRLTVPCQRVDDDRWLRAGRLSADRLLCRLKGSLRIIPICRPERTFRPRSNYSVQ
jgi:hypothetical protein